MQVAKREVPMFDRRELYQSPSGDVWYLGRESENGRAFIIHQPNGPCGGQRSHIELGGFWQTEPASQNSKPCFA